VVHKYTTNETNGILFYSKKMPSIQSGNIGLEEGILHFSSLSFGEGWGEDFKPLLEQA
jgi:hypothetical protein